ncbi:hypothetical protein TWF730_001735 [Orbilia blumenaviensis]|uniref:Uncharacterized protein n=1 Tax=Orbilia blumenaviensis TaxID=1796055 RepID=A0AAV9UPQ7_9PEZI
MSLQYQTKHAHSDGQQIVNSYLLTKLISEAVQISTTEFAEEQFRIRDTYIRPFRKATQDLVQLATVTYPLTGNEPGWEGQETVRGYVFDAVSQVDAVMKAFFTWIHNQESQQDPTSSPAMEMALNYMSLRTAILDYLEVNVATDPYVWSSKVKEDLVPMDIWVLINRLREKVSLCCAANIPDGNSQALQWIMNGVYDEEAELWTMKPEDTKYRTSILGAMIDGLKNLKIPPTEIIDDIKAIAIENGYPESAYQSLPKIVDDLEIIIQTFISNLGRVKESMFGVYVEFINRFIQED